IAGTGEHRTVRAQDHDRPVVTPLDKAGAHHLRHRDAALIRRGHAGIPRRARASAGAIGGRWAGRAQPPARATSGAVLSPGWALLSTGRPFTYVIVSSIPTRRWPPAEREASSTGSVVRPIPVAENVVPSGRSRTAPAHATSAAVVPGIPPGTPMTKSTWMCPP